MSYTTQSDITGRFGEDEIIQLTDRADAGTIDTAVLAKALNDADALIDGYLASRYTLPLATVPQILVGPAADIARFRLYEERASEEVRKRYEDALSLLKLIASGAVVLPPDALGDKPAAAVGMEYFSQTRVFDETSLADF